MGPFTLTEYELEIGIIGDTEMWPYGSSHTYDLLKYGDFVDDSSNYFLQ